MYLWFPATALVYLSELRQPLSGKTPPPGHDAGGRDTYLGGDGGIGQALGRQQQGPADDLAMGGRAGAG